MNEYNTSKLGIILKEYGRNIQKLVDFIVTVEDREKRNNYAKTLIELMRQINPSMRDSQDYSQKLWDDLYIMSGFKLDVDTPYVMPEASLLGKKPQRLSYSTNKIHYKHYGKNVELLIDKAIKLEDEEDKQAAIIYIGRLMKSFYSTWNKENIDDTIIVQHMLEISKNQLKVDLQKVKEEGLFDATFKEKDRDRNDRGGERNERGERVERERGERNTERSGGDRSVKNFKKPKRANDNNSSNNNNNKRRKS